MNVDNKKLLYVSFQSLAEGQAAKVHVTEIVDGLTRAGWSVRLLAPQYSWVSAGLAQRALEFARINVRGALGVLTRRPAAVYMRGHFAGYPLALLARLTGVPVVQELNGLMQDLVTVWPWAKPLSPLFDRLNAFQIRSATLVIANTPALSEELKRRLGVQRCEVVPNGANIDVFHPGAEGGLPTPARFVFFFGAFSKWQGIDTIFEALDSECWPEGVEVLFAGDGQMRSEIERHALVDSRVRYLGVLPQKEIAGLLARSIAGLCPRSARFGHTEVGASPLKMYEILATGRPVVATRLPGLFELVEEHRCGVVIAPDDPVALARAVADLSSNVETGFEMGSRGRDAVVRHHSWSARGRDTDTLLRRLTGEAVE